MQFIKKTMVYYVKEKVVSSERKETENGTKIKYGEKLRN